MNTRPDIPLIERVSAVLVDMLGDEFDPETFFDTLDGETDINEVVARLIKDRTEAKAHAEASKAVAAEYSARAARLNARADADTRALMEILAATGQRSMKHPLGTFTRVSGRVVVQITDESEIPSQLTITTTRPDTDAIKRALDAGEHVPGAELVQRPDHLTVRTK